MEIAGAQGEFHSVPSVEIEGQLYTAWEEGIEREVDFELRSIRNGARTGEPGGAV